MKTFKDKNPINSQLDISCIDKFIANQQIMLQLLAKSKHLNLQKVKTNISISTLIKLRLGDTLRFVIYHYQRHLDQAEKTLII